MISREDFQRGLRTELVGKRLFVFESIDSTNTCAKTLADAGTEEGIVVLADVQTAGRGRLDRTWNSEAGTNLLFSLLLRPELPIERTGLLTFFAAVSVCRALETFIGNLVECKWPNDLLLNGKKICGILLETSLRNAKLEYAVMGIGLNVNQKHFEGDLEMNATSLIRELGTEFDRRQIFRAILVEMDTLYKDVLRCSFGRILEEWNRRCRMFGRPVTVAMESSHVSGTAIGLEADGGLIIRTGSGLQTVRAGDVSLPL
ncbi:MAG: biotin--[acetyl-CoA-carboxylase] ligase [Bacteroidota bacterium]